MTDDDMFGHLDDPAAPIPTIDTLGTVVQRGRHIRARRRSLFAASGAAAAVIVVLGGFGVSRALNASADHDRVLPALTGTATPEPTKTPRKHHPRASDGPSLAPAGQPGGEQWQGGQPAPHGPGSGGCRPTASATDSPTAEATSPDPAPTDADPSASPTDGAADPAPAPSPSDCTSQPPSPDPSASVEPTDTAQPSPSETAQPGAVLSGG